MVPLVKDVLAPLISAAVFGGEWQEGPSVHWLVSQAESKVSEVLVPKDEVESYQEDNLIILSAHMFTFIDTHMDTRPHEHIHTRRADDG